MAQLALVRIDGDIYESTIAPSTPSIRSSRPVASASSTTTLSQVVGAQLTIIEPTTGSMMSWQGSTGPASTGGERGTYLKDPGSARARTASAKDLGVLLAANASAEEGEKVGSSSFWTSLVMALAIARMEEGSSRSPSWF